MSPCGNIGDDDEDKMCAYWDRLSDPNWQDINCDPNSLASKASDTLGDLIDGFSNLIIGTLLLFGGIPIRLMVGAMNLFNRD